MNRFTLISISIHICLILSTFLHVEQKPTVVEIELSESESGTKKTDQKEDKRILEIGDGEGDIEARDHYWGLGLTGEYITNEYGYVYRIDNVYSGYSGEAVGLRKDDVIIAVDGIPMAQNDIVTGDGPKTLSLTIRRGSSTLIIIVDRCKVYI
jgi:C-terminal processing protease CtpA/Prc